MLCLDYLFSFHLCIRHWYRQLAEAEWPQGQKEQSPCLNKTSVPVSQRRAFILYQKASNVAEYSHQKKGKCVQQCQSVRLILLSCLTVPSDRAFHQSCVLAHWEAAALGYSPAPGENPGANTFSDSLWGSPAADSTLSWCAAILGLAQTSFYKTQALFFWFVDLATVLMKWMLQNKGPWRIFPTDSCGRWPVV